MVTITLERASLRTTLPLAHGAERLVECNGRAPSGMLLAFVSTPLIMALRFISILLGVAAMAVTACNPEPMSRAASQQPQVEPGVVATSAGSVVDSGATATAKSSADSTPRDTVRRAFASAVSSGAAKLHLHMAPDRTAQDSTSFYAAVRAGVKSPKWPVSTPPLLAGSILPARRIVAFYGNPLSKRMGVLGEYPPDQMLERLDDAVVRWRDADPSTPVQPALHLIAVVAQGAPGKDGGYRLRMDSTLIEKVYGWAQSRHALLFLDIQAGHSTLQAELPRLLRFLARPDVHLGIDPEFYMHYDREGLRPGTKIGTMDAKDVNYVIRTLTDLVREKQLPPKLLVVHRFTRRMVPNAEEIKPTPEVQVVMDMDGWGPPWLKFDSYRDYEVAHPVEFTGFKLFFHNDTKKGFSLLNPYELLQLVPKPLYIQYQ